MAYKMLAASHVHIIIPTHTCV